MDGKRTLLRLGFAGALVGVEIYLARDLTSHGPVQGFTATTSYSIAPLRAARIKEIAVTLGAPLKTGDVIARLDTTELDNELATANAERRVAAGAVVAQTARMRRDNGDLARRFAASSEQASADLVTAEATAHTAAAELAAVDTELAEQTDLVSKHIANTTLLNNLQLRRAALAKQVDSASSVLRILRGNATAATKRVEGLDTGTDDQLEPLQARLQAAELRVTQLERERDALTLRAPAAGVIDSLLLHAGDLAAPQTPVAVLVAVDSRRVVACLPELRANSVEAGVEADVTSLIDHAHATGAVESITGAIAPLPPRCQPPNAKLQVMGRVAIISLDEPLGGIPGQTQLVRFSARRRPHDRATSAPTPTTPRTPDPSPADGPVPISIPREVAPMNFEPSGLVWVKSLDRYLIVSDDTGYRSQDGHPPWLFAMTMDGVVDPQPLVVSGVDELNDLESITLDDQGGIWVLASQSLSHKGKRPASRRRLAHIMIEKAGALRADHVVDFAGMLDRAPPESRTALGFGDTRQLDIEAMTFHAGALYVGLKAPVDGSGRAQIWRVAAPDKLLAGDLAGAQITLWATVKLTVNVGGKPVPAGLSDLMFWDADTLVFSVTASGITAKLQDGAIYVAKAVGGELTPHHVRTFTDLKPEGLARSPRGDLTVVFDRGAEPALWIQIPAAAVKLEHGP